MATEKQKFKVLAIDGGGIRGVIPAHIINRISHQFEIDPLEHFDLIAGTSTGAIIASALACGITPEKIIALYEEKSNRIFQKKQSWLPYFLEKYMSTLYYSTYDSNALAQELDNLFGDKLLGEISFPLILPATDIGNGCVHIFKSGYSDDFVRDQNVRIQDAILASCCAPTYFDPVQVGDYTLADGGLWANSPALTAAIEAMHRFGITKDRVHVLSIGTGHSINYYEPKINKNWGFLSGWERKKFIHFILSLQSQSIGNHLKR